MTAAVATAGAAGPAMRLSRDDWLLRIGSVVLTSSNITTAGSSNGTKMIWRTLKAAWL